MYIPEALKKVNKFVDVAIPSNRSYFARLGEVSVPSSQFTGDEMMPLVQDKIDSIVDYAEYAEKMANEESNKSE